MSLSLLFLLHALHEWLLHLNISRARLTAPSTSEQALPSVAAERLIISFVVTLSRAPLRNSRPRDTIESQGNLWVAAGSSDGEAYQKDIKDPSSGSQVGNVGRGIFPSSRSIWSF